MPNQPTSSSQGQLGTVEFSTPVGIRDMLNNTGIGAEDGSFDASTASVCLDVDDSDGSSDLEDQFGSPSERGKKRSADDMLKHASCKSDGPKPGKKTKGRVKIKMEFIDNKLRRYTTFSKRKTGIMKKAYELSTLTGTQVMLLVASETGHVYTFATRKLQPMITSESGKALIQTCLNSPDPPATQAGPQTSDQRMSATGFEETELSYQVNEEEGKDGTKTHMFTVTNIPGAGADGNVQGTGTAGIQITGTGHTYPMTNYMPTSTSTSNNTSPSSASKSSTVNASTPVTASNTINTGGNISMQLPGGIATILPAGTSLPPGTAIQVANLPQLPTQAQQLQVQGQLQAGQPQQVYRFQQSGTNAAANLNQMITAVALQQQQLQQQQQQQQQQQASQSGSNNDESQQQQSTTLSLVPTSQVPTTATTLAGHVMYQTAQGIVYAPAPTSLPEGLQVLNYPSLPALSQLQEMGGVQQVTLVPGQTGQTTSGLTQIPIPLTIHAQGQNSDADLQTSTGDIK